MRAEDLYKAMEGIDDELILRSELKIEASQLEEENSREEKRKAKKKKANVQRFIMIAVSTAAAVFLLLIARDLTGTRGLKSAKSSRVGSGAMAQRQEQELDAAAEEAGEEIAPEKAMPDVQAEGAQADAASEPIGEEVPQEAEKVQNEAADSSLETEEESETAQKDSLMENDAETGEQVNQDAVKTAVDLLGERAEEYIGLEYIAAEEEANGGTRKVPDYTEEGEKALTAAFENGKAEPSILAKKGKPIYYVYLTRKGGFVDKATFYENEYVSLDSIPAMVLKISHAEYEAVLELFR
ncbi:MAG: hypothetical protein IJ100_04055 [Lachnospiraceae bacterium]|nr:hypothetical protein [Lachnospiraceae bacterium]